MLEDYPRDMRSGPNANLVSGQLVACHFYSCDIYKGGEWKHLLNGDADRIYASNAVNDDRMLLIGGQLWEDSNTTEWIPVDGSPAQPGPFNAANLGASHCTIQTAPDRIVVTGRVREIGDNYDFANVVEFQLTGDFTVTPLTPMRQELATRAVFTRE